MAAGEMAEDAGVERQDVVLLHETGTVADHAAVIVQAAPGGLDAVGGGIAAADAADGGDAGIDAAVGVDVDVRAARLALRRAAAARISGRG
jgi:hypothetical protein